jgi:hypothetical protein
MIDMPFIDDLIINDKGSFLPLWLLLLFDFLYYFEGGPCH